ncbi:MAG TPA: chloride channel protein [Polyangiaceae bacterium]|nr:chloride channel protein [Polyangiaceae bacterium]
MNSPIKPANHAGAALENYGDFTATWRVVPMTAAGAVIGALAAVIAYLLLRLIGFCTNLFYFQRFSTDFVSPAKSPMGLAMVIVPVIGALIIGFMARYGSERIRGHGIPEALEAILTRGSRVEPRVAFLKPLSAAISIGSGGPFGAEGPIIMTGGAFGSMLAQLFRLTAAERKTLLVAGAAAGMSATFSAPIASVLLAVELLLFEFKPRSFVPVSIASATAMLVRTFLLGHGPLFSLPEHAVVMLGPKGLAACVVLGVCIGFLAWITTLAVYASEDLFMRLPVHWMWWPAIGGLFVGIGGLIEPRALGVGYEYIEQLLRGSMTQDMVLRLALVKAAIWAGYLGSGTSGGVLAPLLMIGSALGGLLGPHLPAEGAGMWPLLAMGAMLSATMGSPLTGIVFAVELTGESKALLPLLVTSTVAYTFTVLVMKRSILTEKVARRGFHITREYEIDPLDVLFARDVMQTKVVGLPVRATPAQIAELLQTKLGEKSRLYAVVDGERMVGVVTRRMLSEFTARSEKDGGTIADIATRKPVTAFADETMRDVVQRMADSGKTRLPVVDRNDPTLLLGMVTLAHTLKAKQRHIEEEQRRERLLTVRSLLPAPFRPARPRPRERSAPESAPESANAG